MLRATKEETEKVREYFEWQAPDLEITFMQKVYSEAVLSTRHDVWDIHTNKDRWWVITDPTNLYSQEQFPNMDLAVTFHIGLCLRIPRTEKQLVDDRRVVPFDKTFVKLSEASDALSAALNLADYQAVGVHSREVLLEFIGAAQDSAEWTDNPPKRADLRGWIEIIVNELLPGGGNKERRGLLKSTLDSAWTFTNWLTHSKSATWQDADMAVATVEYAIGMATSLLIRELRGVPTECPDCGSPHLEPEDGENTAIPGVLWQRPRCAACGWAGRPMPIMMIEGFEGLVTREGEDRGDEHSIMTTPLRSIRKPSDE
ncbi:hypothetical protein [Nitratireductor luteus]|uniref:hypothetical protein n=1 Tax=Nitratireductor luteus TaxID=2976980 RepID=UPI00223F6B96|nr:hypothetical protein [Nitratireductor luteus]